MTSRSSQHNSRRTTWIVGFTSCLVFARIVSEFDFPIAQWMKAGNCPEIIHNVLNAPEPIGSVWGVILMLLGTAYLAGPASNLNLMMLSSMAATELATHAFKWTIPRVRPRHFDFESTSSFVSWGVEWSSQFQSFPSGHTSAAFCFATVFARFYPHGTALFYTVAVMIACQRIESGAHYLSDVVVGAAFGYFFSHLTLNRFAPLLSIESRTSLTGAPFGQ